MRLLRGCNNSDGIAQEKAAVPGRHGGEGTSPERGFGSGGELTHLAGGAEQFDRPFAQDRLQFLDEASGPLHWTRTIDRFCQNVREIECPPDIWSGLRVASALVQRSVRSGRWSSVSHTSI